MSETSRPTTDPSIEQIRHLGSRLQLMENPYVVGLATAVVLTDLEVDLILGPNGTIPADVVADLDQRIQVATEQANSSFFRYDIRAIDPVANGSVVELVDDTVLLSELATETTRKITVLVALSATSAEGPALLRVPAFDKEQPLRAGTAYLFPAFVAPTFSLPEGVSFTGLVLHAYGPAFR